MTMFESATRRQPVTILVLLLTIGAMIVALGSSQVFASDLWADCAESLYVANEGNGGGGVDITVADCHGNVSTFATGVSGPSGLATDGTYLYVSDDGPGYIYRFDSSGSATTLTPTTLGNPNAIAVDQSGRVLVADTNDGLLRRLTVDSAANVTDDELIADFSIITSIVGVAVDSNGDVLFADEMGQIYKITTSMSLPVTLATPGLALGVGVVVSGNIGHLVLDASDNIYLGDFNARIVRVNAAGTDARDVVDVSSTTPCDSSQTGVGGDQPAFRGFAIDSSGDLYVSGYCLDNVYRFSQSDLENAWMTNTPITILPGPVLENPASALDGPDFNGAFGLLFWTGPTTAVYQCQGVPATIVGTPGNDTIFGTSGDDVIVGLQGDDIIFGGGGNDRICGGSGDDEIYGEDGNDTIFGGRGRDVIYGGLGNDDISGFRGADTIWGEEGDDHIHGNRGNDVIYGGPGNDDITGDQGSDVLFGGAGQDYLYGRFGNDFLFGQNGNDTLLCGAGTDFANGGAGIDSSSANCETQVNIP